MAIPSTTGDESAAIECTHGWLQEVGADELDRWDVDMAVLADDPDYPGREVERDVVPVVAAQLVGDRPGPTVTLTGHVDTVPSGDRWSSDPFTPRIDGDRVFGLGACDMKGGVVAAVEAFAAIARAGRSFAGEVQIVLVPGEEDGGTGTLAAIRRGYGGGMVIVTEPTSRTGSPEIVVAHGGALTFTIEVTGRSAHASIAPEGENALRHFWGIHQALTAIEQQINSQEQNPLMVALGTPYATNVGKISGGVWSASVMENLRAEVRMGVSLHETIAEAEQRVIQGVQSAITNNKWLAEHPPTIVRTGGVFGSAETPADHQLVRTLADTAESLTGRRPQNIGVPYGCDMALWQRVGKSTPIVYGPGDIRQAHAPDEWVSIQQVEEVAAVLEQTCYALLKPATGND
ncbi:ArgE/DapE family deacylase [soil metagenome]